MISVKILFFSVLKQKLGRDCLIMTLDECSTGKHLLDVLADSYSAIASYREAIRLAVNESYVKESHLLKEGDEVALITPVSGG